MQTYTVTIKVKVPNKLKTNCREIKDEIENLLGWELELGKPNGKMFGGTLVTPSVAKITKSN